MPEAGSTSERHVPQRGSRMEDRRASATSGRRVSSCGAVSGDAADGGLAGETRARSAGCKRAVGILMWRTYAFTRELKEGSPHQACRETKGAVD